MRVTKVIREYVEREICAKFDPEIDKIGAEYQKQRDELDAKLEGIMGKAEAEAYEIAKSMGFDYTKSGWGRRGCIELYTNRFEKRDQCAADGEARRALEKRKREAIDSVLLGLELGETTKSELKSAIDAVSVV